MDYHVFKDVVNRYYAKHVGGDQRPVFFDIPNDYPELDAVTRSYPAIRAELNRLLIDAKFPRYHDLDHGEREISEGEHDWTVFMLEILGHLPELNRAQCPMTCLALEQVPNLMQAFFSILDPMKAIPEHEGPYLGYLRYHLGLQIPTDIPPSIVVNGLRYQWREGEAVLFDDSWPHRVVNESQQRRAVLVVDVMRPMPFMPTMLNRFTANVIARNTYGRGVAKKVEQYAA